MLIYQGKEITGVYWQGKEITNLYAFLKEVWSAVSSAFGSGIWRDDLVWSDEDVWVN